MRRAHYLLPLLFLLFSCQEQEWRDTLEPQVPPCGTGALTLLDSEGEALQQVPETFGRYRLIVNTPGAWRLQSDQSFLSVDRTEGIGTDTLWATIGRNWEQTRAAELQLITDSAGQAESAPLRLQLQQRANGDLAAVAQKVNSSTGAGYTYCPTDRFTMGTGIQVFNLHQFPTLETEYCANLVIDDYYPTIKTTVLTSDSLSDLQTRLKLTLTAEVNLLIFTVNFEGSYTHSNVSEGNRTYAAQRLSSTMFTRELNYMNALALVEEHPELETQVFTPGFLMLQDQLVQSIHNAGDYETKQRLCRSFIKSAGPCFISKSMLGCSIDYWISTQKSTSEDEMRLEAKLQFMWDQTIKVDVHSEGNYTETERKVLNETQANVDLRGGDVQRVSILTTGGQLPYAELQHWMLDIRPEQSVLIDMRLEPIYKLFRDKETKEALREYLNQLTQ